MKKQGLFSASAYFRATSLYKEFSHVPFGYIDIGAAGEVPEFILPAADISRCMCFEPDPRSRERCAARLEEHFAAVKVSAAAVAGKKGQARLYATRSGVNSSLLEPYRPYSHRYNLKGFDVVARPRVKTETLDSVTKGLIRKGVPCAELIKVDCQGLEYDILRHSRATLAQCVCLYVETEFRTMYRGQKLFADVDCLLRDSGFSLYGLYPHFVSSKKLDRRSAVTEERLLWADALYFRDPVESGRRPARRQLKALLFSCLLMGYFDFALELADRFLRGREHSSITRCVRALARSGKKSFERELDDLGARVSKRGKDRFVLGKKFLDRHRSNSDLDFIKI
jgi:FkbM family methyltransferase